MVPLIGMDEDDIVEIVGEFSAFLLATGLDSPEA